MQAQSIPGFPAGMMMPGVPAQIIQPGFMGVPPMMMQGGFPGVPQQARPQMGYYGNPAPQFDLLGQLSNLNLN